MIIRALRFCLLGLLLTVVPVSAAELTIVRTFTGWREAASFKRISEYFDGKENTGGEAILRTRPEHRAGYYFLLRVANAGAPLSVSARLQVITTTETKPQAFAFAPALKSGDTVVHLGLTGPDWPDAKADPVAWKLDLVDAAGRVLASTQSYLWEKPAGK